MKGKVAKANISMEQYQECPKCGMVVIDYDESDPPTRKEIAIEWKYHNEVECPF